MEINEFKDIFKRKISQIEVDLNDNQIEQFYKYMNLLIEWNKKINLTAIVEPNEIIDKHFIDSLLPLRYVDKKCTIIDVGTGAGFPGIPIKIAFPEVKVVLLDSLNKRINFLKEVEKELGLKELEFIHGRAEDEGRNIERREKYDYAISRAVAPLNIILEYMSPFIKKDGRCICMKASKLNDEIRQGQNAIRKLSLKEELNEEFILPETDINRNIIVLRKINILDKIYPRKAGTPTRKPL